MFCFVDVSVMNENGLTRYFNSGTRGPWQEVETGNADSQNDTFKLIFFLKSITNVDQYRFTLNEHVQAR